MRKIASITALLLICLSLGCNKNIFTDSKTVELYPVLKDGKWGYMNKKGRVVIRPEWDYVGRYSEGLAGVREGDKWGFIDVSGMVVIKPRFEGVGEFSEGLAPVGWGHGKMGGGGS